MLSSFFVGIWPLRNLSDGAVHVFSSAWFALKSSHSC